MKVLLHICCAPCSIAPIKILREEGADIMGFFYRHNIHPFTECIKREETLYNYSEKIGLRVIYQKNYELEKFIQNIVFREKDRCRFCFYDRLNAAAAIAVKGKFDYFTTSLLYSKFQNHEMIKSIGEAIQKNKGIKFLYRDFRQFWKYGIEESKRLSMYRQNYCGCIYSEKERFFKKE